MDIGTWHDLPNATCERCGIHTLDVEWALLRADTCPHNVELETTT